MLFVPAATKCNAIYHMLRDEISTDCPASVLRRHENAILFCDPDSASRILLRKAIITDEISQNFNEAAELAAKYGCEALELRSVWDKPAFELTDKEISIINTITREKKLKICAISSPVFKCRLDDRSEIKKSYEIFNKCILLAEKTGAEYIRVFTFWKKNDLAEDIDIIKNELGKLADKAAGKSVKIAVEIDPSVNVSNADDLKFLFENMDYDNVKILWDPGNQIYNKEFKIPYPDGYELIKDKIAHFHLKDAVRSADGEAEGVVLGSGMLNAKGQLAALISNGYDGYVVLEPHFRPYAKLSDEELRLPGGADFSKGGYEASELSFIELNKILEQIVGEKQ